ncbi:glycoside hydrolase family 130 protein [Pinibacter aurantiacus]|uniref:Glycoside hydrolase family 130 protein n=1 Tax=Pinibacter aurantiacus TaxID=2851599 RepID=A0A9E2W343_9BACT|nr:glycoside hydrolase family 130 protein [Pinibacter aurantiacus]MBV4355833.1 glycoside hydrolase family 130 protein [Pinibacter aurantiacus]
MSVNVIRKNILFEPDASRVIARFLFTTEERSMELITRVLALSDNAQHETLTHILRDFSKRHRSISRIFEKHFHQILYLFLKLGIDLHTLTTPQKVLIGAYFTMEYSNEAAAFFNPSMMEDPDQSELAAGEKRVIISFRATGEGHVSSVVFRSGIIDANNDIVIDVSGKMLESPEHVKNHIYHKESFSRKIQEMQDCNSAAYSLMMAKLTDTFTYEELKRYVLETTLQVQDDSQSLLLLNEVMWLASSHYEINFSLDTAISERVIFPIADTEKKGIEDARFVRFIDDDGEVTYYATYTAYDGVTILPKLLLTKDFYQFRVLPIHGEVAQNKGMALFPRKINNKFAMLCRVDGVNNYIAFSENINVWREAKLLQTPRFSWEFVQMGNCGSPIETPDGWLVITHGVGAVREYVLGVSLLDLENPAKEIGRLSTPLLMPNEKEREGYVPNVLYSCGSMIHNGQLIIPYAMSDHASTYATVNLADLLAELKNSKV